MPKKPLIALVEPCFNGLGYIDSCIKSGYDFISIVSDPSNPKRFGYEGKYRDIIIADVRSASAIISAIRMSPYLNKIDAMIPGVDYVIHTTANAVKCFNLIGATPEATARGRRKDLAQEAYDLANVPHPKYVNHVKTVEDAACAAAKIGYPVIMKPVDCCGSHNVLFAQNEAELKKRFALCIQNTIEPCHYRPVKLGRGRAVLS